MPNEKEVFGMPKVLISFKTKSTTAISRSARGIVVMILKNEETDTMKHFKINDVTDIPEKGLTDKNIDLIKKCLLGTPLRILVYTIPLNSVLDAKIKQSNVLKEIANLKWNYICAPTATGSDHEDLASWIKTQRNNKHKTFKAVLANTDADDKGIINFCTGNIKVNNPDYVKEDTVANVAIVGESMIADSVIAKDTQQPYLYYTATEYTARIAGILAGLALDRSATYYGLKEVAGVETYEDIDTLIDKGQLLLVDEGDGEGAGGGAGETIRGVVKSLNEELTKFKNNIQIGLNFNAFIEVGKDAIQGLINKTLEFDGIGSVLAGGTLILGLTKIYKLITKIGTKVASVIKLAKNLPQNIPGNNLPIEKSYFIGKKYGGYCSKCLYKQQKSFV